MWRNNCCCIYILNICKKKLSNIPWFFPYSTNILWYLLDFLITFKIPDVSQTGKTSFIFLGFPVYSVSVATPFLCQIKVYYVGQRLLVYIRPLVYWCKYHLFWTSQLGRFHDEIVAYDISRVLSVQKLCTKCEASKITSDTSILELFWSAVHIDITLMVN